MTAPTTPAAGWYADPYGVTRWWDGHQWTDHTQQPQQQVSAPKPSNQSHYISRHQRLSKVADRDDGDLRCPKCGGSQFKARRSNTSRMVGVSTLGVGAVLTPRSQVQCVTCGAKFRRG